MSRVAGPATSTPPALDLRLMETNELECDEAVLTGESMAAVKTVEPTSSDSAVDLPSCAFMGTIVHQGSGRAVVVATGSATAFGKIALGLGERHAETAFQAGLRGFSKLLVRVAAVLTISIFVINVAFSRPFPPSGDHSGAVGEEPRHRPRRCPGPHRRRARAFRR